MRKIVIRRDENGCCEKYAWPGGYLVFYICANGGILCPDCVDAEKCDKQWFVIAQEINYEDGNLYCDHCGNRIESAYAD